MEEKTESRSLNQTDNESVDDGNEGGVTFGDIMRMIGKHWIGLIAFIIVSVIGGAIYTFGFEKPVWTSTGSVIILADNNTSSDDTTTDSSLNSTNLNLSLALVPSIVDFMNAGDVITDTATTINTKYSTSYSYDKMNDMVTVASRTYTSTEKSLFIDISASSSSKDLSQDIANAVIDNAISLSNDTSKKYYLAFGGRIVISTTAGTPKNTAISKAKVLLIAFAVGLVLGILYGIIFELCDTRVKNSRDIEFASGIKVIGVIPDFSKDEGAMHPTRGIDSTITEGK